MGCDYHIPDDIFISSECKHLISLMIIKNPQIR